MPISELAELDGVTVGSTELSVISGTTTLSTSTTNGLFQLWLDPVAAALAKSDYFRVRYYEKVEATGGSKRVVWSTVIGNAQAEPWVLPALMFKHGWDMTLQKVAGTDRAWDASVRGVGTAVAEPYELDGVTVGASELSLVSGTTTLQTVTDDGFYQFFVDASNMAKGDEFVFRVYEKVEATGGTKRQVYEATLHDVVSENFVTPQFCLMHGWDATLQKVSGTDRAFDASVRRIP